MADPDRNMAFDVRLVLVGGCLAMGLGALALLGWQIEQPLLTGFGAVNFPMAPITALLFVLHGATLVRCAGRTLTSSDIRVTAAIHVASALLCSILFVSTSAGIYLPIERLGFRPEGTVAGIAIGRLSPVTALGFLLSSGAYLATLASHVYRILWVGLAAWWFACALIGLFTSFLLAYLFGAPLLYNAGYAPPALNTCSAFLGLGLGLLAISFRPGRGVRRRVGQSPSSSRMAAFAVFVLLSASVVTGGYLYFRSSARTHRTEVQRALASIAELKVAELVQYRAERMGDALVFLGNVAFADLVQRYFADRSDTDAREHLKSWLDQVRIQYRYQQLSLLDADMVERVAVPDTVGPMSTATVHRAADVLRSGEPEFVDFHRNDHDQRVALEILVPILGEGGARLGVLGLRIDPETHIYPLMRWPSPSETGSIHLVRRDGDRVLFLSSPRSGSDAAFALRLPLASTYYPAVRAALGHEGIVSGLNHRGVPVVAAVHPVADTPWGLVVSMAESEAYAPLREHMWLTIAMVVAFLMTSGIAVAFNGRQQRAQFYQAQYEAERERTWLRDVLARSLNEIYVFDPDSLRFTFVNTGACRNIGYSVDELAAMTPLDIKPEFVEDAFRRMLEPLRKGEVEVMVFETVHRRKDGSEYAVEVHLQHLPAGDRPVYLAVINDVTERVQAEAQFRQAQKMEAVGRLAGGVAHDFNNQVFVITGYCDLLSADVAGKPEWEGPLEEIRKAARRAAALTAQLLAFSRKQVLQPRVLDLNAELAGIDTMMRRMTGESVDFSFIPAPDLGHVKVDPNQLHQVVMNLVVNACDAMPNGGKLTIETRNVVLDGSYTQINPDIAPGRYVLLTISDTGQGMTRETLAHLYEPFFTTKEQGKGTGLGLATAYGIIKQSAGHIAAYSEPGQGATFKVYLPQVDESVDTNETHAAEFSAGGSETILLAEDEQTVRDLVHRVLTEHGYDVLCAANGRAAIALAEGCARPIHLLLTDVVMPEMSGSEVAEEMRRLHPEARVLFMSGYTEDAIVHHGVLAAGLNFLPKPCPTSLLLRRVREVLDGRSPIALRGRRVLLVDDSEDERILQALVLSKVGCEVLQACDGLEALEILERETVDAVLTDVNMPLMNGFALTEAIRRSPRLRALPVIILSGASSDDDHARSRAAGATVCLDKGTATPQEILRWLAETSAK
jgi:PAS domain S-box-containing protein